MPTPLQIEPDYQEGYDTWKADQGPAGASAILSSIKPVLDTAVSTYGGLSAGPTLKTKAKTIVLDALPKYDPAKGKLKPFLMSHLQGLRRSAGDETSTIKIPERIKLDHSMLVRATHDLTDSLNRPPSDAELADHTGISVNRIGKIRSAAMPAVGQAYSDVPATPVGQKSDQGWDTFVYLTLPPQDQLIMEYSRGWNGRPTLGTAEIAKLLRVTPAAVSQKKARIQAILDERGSQ